MSEQSQDLTSAMQEMLAQMRVMRAELDSLKARTQILTTTVSQPKAEVSTTRRRLLQQLAGGLVAGLTVAGIGVSSPNEAEAKLSSNPSGNGLTGRVGMLVMPPGTSVSGTMGGGSGNKVGLLVTGDNPSFNIPAVVAPTVSSAIIGYTSNNGSAIAGISQTGIGVYGSSDTNSAVWGKSNSGNGVQGESASSTGVYGTSTSPTGAGTYGYCASGKGIYGSSTSGIGVYGFSTGGTAAVYGYSSGTYAGYFSGTAKVTSNLEVGGTLSKGGGSFKVDHPLDPANKYLYHSFVESPDMMNIYNGLVIVDEQGEASVEMPDWFEALNFDLRYQLTALDRASPNLHIAQRLKECKFKIAGGQPGQEVSWQVTGIRQDAWAKAHRIPVEEVKTDKEKGKYLHPELFGQPEEMSVHPRPVVGTK